MIVSAILALVNLRGFHLFEVFHFPTNCFLDPFHVRRLIYTGYLRNAPVLKQRDLVK